MEKLLRSCPGVKKILLLIRPSEKSSCQQRLDNIASLSVRIKIAFVVYSVPSKFSPSAKMPEIVRTF